MKNKKGFISISLIYSFFLIMLMLLVLIIGRLLNSRVTLGIVNDELKQSNYEKNFEIPLPVGVEKPSPPPPQVDPPAPEIPEIPEIVDDGYWFYKNYTTSETGGTISGSSIIGDNTTTETESVGYKKITIEKSGTYFIEVLGAQGGRGMNDGSSKSDYDGGYGARVAGEIYLYAGEVIYAYVGGKGANATDQEAGATGGYNGGGTGGKDSNVKKNKNEPGGGGGGASDIRCFYNATTGRCEENTTNLAWNDPVGLNSRIIVAGGGGGGNFSGRGGAGGILTGASGVGTLLNLPNQTTGYAFGYGKEGGSCTDGGGGGGGGWYGGYTGGCNTGGGGGSSYISGYKGCSAIVNLNNSANPREPKCSTGEEINNQNCSIHPSGKTFTNISVTEGYNSGVGNVLIVYLNPVSDTNIVYEYTTIGEKEITIERGGVYKLEVWGGQGGTGGTGGGRGGFSVGFAVLKKNQKLYVNVGGQGETKSRNGSDVKASGGYNGGGTGRIYNMGSKYSSYQTGGGGGATHIATISGTLNTLSSSKSNILIVAGGGGGGGYANNTDKGAGGSGGGYKGNAGGCNESSGHHGSGGTQSSAGKSLNLSYTYGEGGFGYGSETGTGGNSVRYGGAGGGGYYGGGGNSPGSKCGGGGGSGYIGNEKLIAFRDKEKYMVCYKCNTSSSIKTYTISNQLSSDTPVADHSKTGAGAARITYIA